MEIKTKDVILTGAVLVFILLLIGAGCLALKIFELAYIMFLLAFVIALFSLIFAKYPGKIENFDLHSALRQRRCSVLILLVCLIILAGIMALGIVSLIFWKLYFFGISCIICSFVLSLFFIFSYIFPNQNQKSSDVKNLEKLDENKQTVRKSEETSNKNGLSAYPDVNKDHKYDSQEFDEIMDMLDEE